MLPREVHGELDRLLTPVDDRGERLYPGERPGRQPVHTVYVPADRYRAGLAGGYGRAALAAVAAHGPLPFTDEVTARVMAKLASQPVEDLRIDFEDGYGVRDDLTEDASARAAAAAVVAERAAAGVPEGGATVGAPLVGIRCKSLERATRSRAVRTLDLFLEALGPPPDGFVITLPKVSVVEQVDAMVLLCGRLEAAHGLPTGRLRFEIQIETPPAVLGADGTATVARMVHAAKGRCVGLHYGTYDYTAGLGIAAAQQSLEHPAADHAKAVMQVAAAGTGVWVSDGSVNVLPVGDGAAVRAAWGLHARLVRRGLERGFYQGWDLHPAQLPTRFGATYEFFREAAPAAVQRLRRYWRRQAVGVLDEPATARALARFLLRGLDCGALDADEIGLDRSTLAAQ